jgi:hypothetical protein
MAGLKLASLEPDRTLSGDERAGLAAHGPEPQGEHDAQQPEHELQQFGRQIEEPSFANASITPSFTTKH